MREVTLATGALPALLTIITACLAAATSARHQSYVICKEPDSYICQACPLLPEFNELVHNWVSGEAGSCILVEELPNIISPPFYSFKTLGGGEIEMDCNEVIIVSEAKARGILRVRRQIGAQPRGRYRGQTQSQYLAIDHGGKEEGKAEAHSAADSSRASVSGNSGMGQAQSQSIYDPSCDDCYGRTTPDAGNLKKKPFDVSDRHDGYGSSGWTGPINGTPIKNTFGSNQNIGPGLGGSGQPQPGPQSYEQHYRGPGEGTLAPGSAREPGTGVPNGNSGFDPNGNRNMQGTGPGKELGTFQTDPLLTKGGPRLGPSISGYGPTQQSNGGYDPNTRDRQGSSLGPEHGDMHYNTFGPGRINAPGSDSFPPGSLMNSPVGTGAPGQERVISTDGRPNQNNYGTGSSPGLYSPGQNSVLIPGNGPALTGTRYVSPGSLGPTIPNGIYNVNQARDPNGLGGANQVGEPGRGYSPDIKNSGIRGSEQPSGNWPVGSYIPGTSPYFCCVVGPDGNIIPAGGLPYNRGLNINSQYPNGNKYALSGQGFDPRNTGQNIGIGSTPPLQTSYGVGDPRYGGNTGQDPRSSIYGPISGSEKSFTPDQKVPGNSDNSINQNIPNNYMQRPGVSDVSGGYKPAYAPGQSGVYKQGITPGVSDNFSPGQGSLGSFGPGHVDGLSNLGSYIPGHEGNLRDNTYGPGQVYGTRFRSGYGPEDTDGQGSTGSERDRNNGIRFTNDYHRPDHTIIPSGGGESGTYRPGQNAGSFGPPSTGNFAPGNLNSGYRPGLSSDKYGPGSTSGIYLPGQNIGGYGPSHASGSYGPGDASGSYGPDIVSGSYGPGQSSGNSGPGQATGSYMPSQATGTYGPGQESGSYGPGQASGSYGPNQVSGGYGPGQASGGYRPDQVNVGYGPGQASGGYRPGQVSGGYVPDQASGGYRPGQASGGYGPGQANGGYGPGQASGGYGPGQASGGYGPGQASGGYGPSQGSGGYGPGQASGGYGPGQANGGYGPSQGSGGYGPGQASGGYGPGQASGGYGPGQASSDYRPGQASGGYDQSLGPSQNNVSGGGDFFTQRGVNPLSQGAYGPSSPGESYGSVGRPGDSGRFNINEPIFGSDKYGGGAIGNGYDPRLFGHTSNYNGVPQNFTDPNTLAEGDDSAAEASVSQAANGTTASASSRGGNDKGRAQTNVHGTYTGGGSFSAQALITGENKEAESEVTGGKKGASSAAQGSGRNNKSQANVQLGSETGSVQTQSLTNGAYHSSNSQVQGSVKGGMADAQARGPGSTSSQAQIGFTPYKDGDKSHDLQKVPFVGGGLASAQSSGRIGQSQSQLHGTFKYGITYNGAAQAGSSIDKDAVFPNRLSFDKIDVFDEKEKNINVDTETSPALDISSTTSTTPILEPEPTEESLDKSEDEVSTESDLNALNTKDESEKEDETLKNSESRYSSHTHLDHHKTNDEAVSSPVSSSATRSFQSSYGNNGAEYEYTTDKEDVQPDEYDTDGQEEEQGEYVNYDDIPRDTLTHQSLQSPRNSLDVKQSSGGNTQHIVLGSFKNHDAEITQKNSESPDESKTYQPGERVPGTGGYTIPIGFTGSVKSVASKEKTYVVGSKESPSQAQTVTLTPGSGRVKYSYLPPSYGRVEAGKLRSLATRPRDNRYVSVSKSVARDLDAEDNVRKQYSHSYYTKSSSCGFFTFTCTMVSGADGKKKVCSPKIPRNPDGTPIRC